MMRALWTASTGMIAQQFNVDVISNNLANVNTTSYKKEKAEFKDLLYSTLNRAAVQGGTGNPVNLQVGHGTRVIATVKDFSTGHLERTENPLDFAINGPGFFKVLGPRGQIAYTRDGSFKLSLGDEGTRLVTSEGYPVLDENDSEIIFDFDISSMIVSSEGDISYLDETNTPVFTGMRIGLARFANRQGLESIGENLYMSTTASGMAMEDSDFEDRSVLMHKFIESSNVQVVEEMVKLIAAQRAYEVSSKAIQSADDMLGMANNLRR